MDREASQTVFDPYCTYAPTYVGSRNYVWLHYTFVQYGFCDVAV